VLQVAQEAESAVKLPQIFAAGAPKRAGIGESFSLLIGFADQDLGIDPPFAAIRLDAGLLGGFGVCLPVTARAWVAMSASADALVANSARVGWGLL
jgi:hypothetical protein